MHKNQKVIGLKEDNKIVYSFCNKEAINVCMHGCLLLNVG